MIGKNFFDGVLGLMALIGLVGTIGVAVNDSIVMMDEINHRKRKSGKLNKQVIMEGTSSRLRAIILTTVTTLGGVFPMAYSVGGESGFTRPLAFSMGWGLSLATLLTLFFLPCLLMIHLDLVSLFRWLSGFIWKNRKVRERVLEHPISLGGPVVVEPTITSKISEEWVEDNIDPRPPESQF